MADQDNWRAQVRKGWIEMAILAALWKGRVYGLEILRRLEDESDLVVTEGTIYPLLNRLRKAGLVNAEWEESESGHPRKYYALTAAGRRHCLWMARESVDFIRQMNKLLKPVLQEEP